jgi:hypothetical protein
LQKLFNAYFEVALLMPLALQMNEMRRNEDAQSTKAGIQKKILLKLRTRQAFALRRSFYINE